MAVEGEFVARYGDLGTAGGHGRPRNTDPIAEAIAIVLMQVASGDHAPAGVHEVDALAEAGDFAVVDRELVVPDNGDAVSGSHLVGNGSHELEAFEGHGVARHVEQVEVAVFGVARGGRRVPVRRVIRLSRLDLAHVHEFGRAEQGDTPVDDDRLGEKVLSSWKHQCVPCGGSGHGLLNRRAGEAFHLQALGGSREGWQQGH